jgi:hypothetical protein
MLKNKMKNKLVLFSFLIMTATTVFGGCGPLNNPFVPAAEISVTKITSLDAAKGVSILQSFKKSGETLITEYKFNEPLVTIVNRPGLPRVIYKQAIVEYTIGNKKLPAQKFPAAITVPAGGQYEGSVPILSLSEELINAVFPNNSFFSAASAFAEVTLLGIDDNNNIIATKFSTPIRFETDPTNFIVPGSAASASPNASPSP